MRPSGINPGFPGLSRSSGQIGHVLRTRSPLRQTPPLPEGNASLDLHALGAPPAFVLSQDQTLQRQSVHPAPGRRPGGGLNPVLVFSASSARRGRPGRKGLIRPAGGKNTGKREYIPNRPALPWRGRGRRNDFHSAFDTLFSCQGAPGADPGSKTRRRRREALRAPVPPPGLANYSRAPANMSNQSPTPPRRSPFRPLTRHFSITQVPGREAAAARPCVGWVASLRRKRPS